MNRSSQFLEDNFKESKLITIYRQSILNSENQLKLDIEILLQKIDRQTNRNKKMTLMIDLLTLLSALAFKG